MSVLETSEPRARRIIVTLTPIAVIGVGLLVLAGWALDSAVLKSVGPDLPAMNPMTAVAFVLVGISLWFLSWERFHPLAQFFSMIVVVITLLRLGEIVFDWTIAIDQLLLADKLQTPAGSTGMAPNTAASLLLVSVALFLSSRKSARWSLVVQGFTLIAELIAFLSVLGYVYEVELLYRTPFFLPTAAMAIHTAVTLIVLCIGTLAIQPEVGVIALWRSQMTGGTLARRLITASVIVLLTMGWLQLAGERAGIFDSLLGETLFETATAILLIGVIWWTARIIDRSEANLHRSEARFRALFEYSSDAIILLNESGNFVDANASAETMTGYTHEELLQQSVGALASGDLVGQAALLFDEVKTKGSWRGELDLVRKDGSGFTGEISVTGIASGLYQGIIHDINDRKKAEENLRNALEQERRLNELKSRFVAMVSHEFRTPLAVIRSSTDLLLHYSERTTPEKRRERLEKIQQEISVMVQLLDDILILRRAEDSSVTFRPEPLDLYEFCLSLITEIQPVLATHQIEFTSSGDCANVYADPKLMRQAVTNLISNAVKYSPERQSIHLELLCGEKEIILHVRDEGIGIPEEDQAKLFEVFHRASNVGTISGTGLGLPIIKQAVEAHGGSIVVASEQNVGTTFTISLPRRAGIQPSLSGS